uniref:Uncharacterized protein n=1 Tax=Arundo donax TaxID=35708 RepID=A0A0A8ZRJ0_ARUDO
MPTVQWCLRTTVGPHRGRTPELADDGAGRGHYRAIGGAHRRRRRRAAERRRRGPRRGTPMTAGHTAESNSGAGEAAEFANDGGDARRRATVGPRRSSRTTRGLSGDSSLGSRPLRRRHR